MAERHLPRLHWADYLVTGLSLVVSLGIGIFFAVFKGGQKTREQYLVGGRQMGLAPVCLSLFVSYQSAISLIGTPSDTYNTGTMVFYNILGVCLSYVVGYFTVVPLIYPLRLTSIYQYLLMRFKSQGVRYLVTFVGMTQMTMYMGIALYSPALVLQAVAGLPLWLSLAVVGIIGTIYTAIGGIKSVVWTDVFQTVMVFTGIVAVLIKGLMVVGGISQMWDIAKEGGRLIFDDMDLKARHSVWSSILGSIFVWLICLVNQCTAQRISALPSLRHAKWCFILNMPLNLVYGASLCFMGLLLYAYFVTTGCDPYAAGYIQNKNQVAPYFVLDVMRDLPGMTGLYLSMLFCGSLSTLSSGINSLAANTVEDVLTRPLRGVKDTTVTVIAKCIVLVYGCLSLGLAYVMKNVPGPVTQLALSVSGSLGSPVLGVLFLAAGFPRSNKYGAGGGLVLGLAVSLTVGIGATIHGRPTPSLPSGPVDRCVVGNGSWTQSLNDTASEAASSGEFTLWDLSYLWFSVLGFFTTVLSGMVLSLLTGYSQEPEAVDPRLIFPFCRKLCGLPEPGDKTEEEEMTPVAWKEHQTEKTHEEDVDTSAFITKEREPPSV